MKTHTTTNYAAPIFYAYVSDYAKNGENAITETTFESFLREFVEDPAAAWVVKKNDDGKFEVRTNFFNQYTPGKLHGTFDTESEAEQFLLDGLNWDFSNKYSDGPSYDFDRAELVNFLNESTSADL